MSTIKTVSALVDAGLVAPREAPALGAVAQRYAIALTPALAALIDPCDVDDPIARQFVPDARELDRAPHELADPIGDAVHSPVPGIVHRYRDRVLLKLVHVCPVYCRFCFRREMVGPGGEPPLSGESLERALDYIRAHDEIWEVILTGGDPFMVPARIARTVTESLAAVAHVRVIRWHTRMAVADPERVTMSFVEAIASSEKPVYVALHVNHERELSQGARAAILRLQSAGIALLSQSVLLKGINDDAARLDALFRALVQLKVKPYYLHQMDPAPGTGHFRVPLARAQEIYSELRLRLSGLALPAFVIDIPGGHGKVPAAKSHLRPSEDGYVIADDRGRWLPYRGAASERTTGVAFCAPRIESVKFEQI
jgi:lysine 2,3-aminomutase